MSKVTEFRGSSASRDIDFSFGLESSWLRVRDFGINMTCSLLVPYVFAVYEL